ncbi:hypothetical protein VTO73DRAFT_7336 [Trametes versicolor]
MAATSRDESRSAYTSVHADRTGRSDGPHRNYIRHQILHQHLESTLRQASASTNSNVSQSLALSSILRSGESVAHHEDVRMAGGLSPDDLANMTPVSLSNLKLQPTLLRNLENALKKTLLAVAEYYSPDVPDAEDDADDPLQSASQLPDRIRHQRAALTQQHTALQTHRAHVLQLVEQINAAQPALESQLVTALSTLPPHLRATRTAQADVLAATVEAALLKLSLVRARAHRALYSFPSSSSSTLPGPASSKPNPAKTVGDAVAAAHGALRARAAAQDAEMGAQDGQIAAYEGMLGLVEGGRGREGAFAQVVRDMARVKRETEECRRELMRLGWTGD